MLPDNFRSKNLNLPYIAPAQAQKHVTLNEGLRALDALVQLSVLARDIAAPPSAPEDGARYIVPEQAAGAWAGQAGRIAAWQDGAWAYYAPQPGWRVWCEADSALLAFETNGWTIIGGAGAHANLSGLGIGTSPDSYNRLAVVSPAALFTHAGEDHRIAVNKAGPSHTASLIYQSNYSGRAEMGVAGDDDFRLKVSPDGTAWHDALRVDRHTGLCHAKKIAFDAYLSSDQTSGPANVVTPIGFDRTVFNTGQYFDTATGRFTPPAGYYVLNVLLRYNGAQDTFRGAAALLKNGNVEKILYRAASGTTDPSLQICAIISASGTDYFEAGVRILGAGPNTILASQMFTHFQGHAL